MDLVKEQHILFVGAGIQLTFLIRRIFVLMLICWRSASILLMNQDHRSNSKCLGLLHLSLCPSFGLPQLLSQAVYTSYHCITYTMATTGFIRGPLIMVTSWPIVGSARSTREGVVLAIHLHQAILCSTVQQLEVIYEIFHVAFRNAIIHKDHTSHSMLFFLAHTYSDRMSAMRVTNLYNVHGGLSTNQI